MSTLLRLSILDQTPIRKGSDAPTALGESIQLARLADSLGYTRYWLSEHHNTTTLAGAALGQTVLAKAVTVAGLKWDSSSAHSASYDAELTADLFCIISNRLRDSFREAEERACELGWISAAADVVSEEVQMETEAPAPALPPLA